MDLVALGVFFFKQKTAYEMRISDWSSDVCSSDLLDRSRHVGQHGMTRPAGHGNRAQLALLDMPDDGRRRRDEQLHTTREHVLNGRPRTLVRNMHHIDRKSVV